MSLIEVIRTSTPMSRMTYRLLTPIFLWTDCQGDCSYLDTCRHMKTCKYVRVCLCWGMRVLILVCVSRR